MKLSNGYFIEVEIDKVGLSRYKLGDSTKYYIQLIDDAKISETEIPKYEYDRIKKLR